MATGWFKNMWGLAPLKEADYADLPGIGTSAYTPTDDELSYVMGQYSEWRGLYDGTALQETLTTTSKQATAPLRYPVQVNLVKSYCILHAGMLFGRGRTGRDTERLLTLRANPNVPGRKPMTDAASRLSDILNYFWRSQNSVLRENALIQQWAGGCIIRVSWDPDDPQSVFGVRLDTIQPEHFWPVWSPTNFRKLISVAIRFSVLPEVAVQEYGLTHAQAKEFSENTGRVNVDEVWNQDMYIVLLGKDEKKDGVVGKWPDGTEMQGPNPWVHPLTKRGLIPFVYIPRLRDGHFFGLSLASDLKGLQTEFNKSLADYGDALGRASHPNAGISDYTGDGATNTRTAGGSKVIAVPPGAIVNLGMTRAGGQSPKIQEFPKAEVPPSTETFIDKLTDSADFSAGLTAAAKGEAPAGTSSTALAASMLPTINLVDWVRDMWTHGIALGGGIDEIAQVIWSTKPELARQGRVPRITPGMFMVSQEVDYRAMIPRDRLEIIDEVVRLATAKVPLSPRNLLARLGDIEDIDEELQLAIGWIMMMAEIEAAVAGRSITIDSPKETQGELPPDAPGAMPTVKVDPPPAVPGTNKQPAKQPQGQKSKTGGS